MGVACLSGGGKWLVKAFDVDRILAAHTPEHQIEIRALGGRPKRKKRRS